MLEIPWIKHSSTIDEATLKAYKFRRIKKGESYRYEVYKGDVLVDNTLDYWGVLKFWKNVSGGEFGYR